jgi:hypothetical protein
MDIPTTVEAISYRSKLDRDGSHSLLEHVLDGLAVIALEQLSVSRMPESESQVTEIDS